MEYPDLGQLADGVDDHSQGDQGDAQECRRCAQRQDRRVLSEVTRHRPAALSLG